MESIFVGNLNFDAEEQDIRDFFFERGYVLGDIKIPLDRETRKPRGFAFIQIDPELAPKLIQDCNGEELMGRKVNLNVAQAPRR